MVMKKIIFFTVSKVVDRVRSCLLLKADFVLGKTQDLISSDVKQWI